MHQIFYKAKNKVIPGIILCLLAIALSNPCAVYCSFNKKPEHACCKKTTEKETETCCLTIIDKHEKGFELSIVNKFTSEISLGIIESPYLLEFAIAMFEKQHSNLNYKIPFLPRDILVLIQVFRI